MVCRPLLDNTKTKHALWEVGQIASVGKNMGKQLLVLVCYSKFQLLDIFVSSSVTL